MYYFIGVFAGLGAIGLVFGLVPKRRSRSGLVLLLGIYLTFLAALGYHTVRTFQTEGFAGTLAHYLFAIVVAEAILLVVGLEAVMPGLGSPAYIHAGVICLPAL